MFSLKWHHSETMVLIYSRTHKFCLDFPQFGKSLFHLHLSFRIRIRFLNCRELLPFYALANFLLPLTIVSKYCSIVKFRLHEEMRN
jgi:hypothetical protein